MSAPLGRPLTLLALLIGIAVGLGSGSITGCGCPTTSYLRPIEAGAYVGTWSPNAQGEAPSTVTVQVDADAVAIDFEDGTTWVFEVVERHIPETSEG